MARKRVLVIGMGGQLARCLSDEANAFGVLELVFVGSRDCDIADQARTSAMVQGVNPGAIINAAAFHDLRACEADFDTAFLVNGLGVRNLLAGMFHLHDDCHLYQLSTDYVFGDLDMPKHIPVYNDWIAERIEFGEGIETSEAPLPLNNYGRTKRAGELIALDSGRATVIRTSSLFSKYGSKGKGGSNFLLGMLKRAVEDEKHEVTNEGDAYRQFAKQSIAVDSDVVMSPTYTKWLARAILYMVAEDMRPPIAHLVCDGPPVSWFDFAKAIFEVGANPTHNPVEETVPMFAEALARLVPKQSGKWPPRPKFSALERSPASVVLGDWRSAIETFFVNEWAEVNEDKEVLG